MSQSDKMIEMIIFQMFDWLNDYFHVCKIHLTWHDIEVIMKDNMTNMMECVLCIKEICSLLNVGKWV